VKLLKSHWNICLLMLVAALVLAACGGDDATPTPTPTAAPATAAAQFTPAPVAAVVDTQTPTTPDAVAPAVALLATPVADSPVAQPNSDGAELIPLDVPTPTPACVVEPNADLVGFADMEARMGCPLADATNEPVAINEFGEGPDYDRFMLWFGSEEQIYVLMPDKTWLAYSDTWSDDEPEISCNPDNLDPPTSPPLPRRGFGKLWCNVESVRLALGTIDREERLCQHAVAQRFEQGRLLACFEDATIRYFRVLDDGTWDMEMVQ
jgi:hypothetical protein